MKKFLFIALSPYVLFFTGLLSILLHDLTPKEYTASSDAQYVCNLDKAEFQSTSRYNWEYICIKERSDRFSKFVRAYNREALKKSEAVPNDKGGCDLESLNSFRFTDATYDLVTRQSWVEACEDPLADKFAKWEENETVSIEEVTDTGLRLSYEAFNYLVVIVVLLPPFLLFYFLYRFRGYILPDREESLIDWLKEQKKFRIFLLLSLLIFFIPLLFLMEDIFENLYEWRNVTESTFILFVLAYPLITILSARFIATSKD